MVASQDKVYVYGVMLKIVNSIASLIDKFEQLYFNVIFSYGMSGNRTKLYVIE